jgi:hypothetical protein
MSIFSILFRNLLIERAALAAEKLATLDFNDKRRPHPA